MASESRIKSTEDAIDVEPSSRYIRHVLLRDKSLFSNFINGDVAERFSASNILSTLQWALKFKLSSLLDLSSELEASNMIQVRNIVHRMFSYSLASISRPFSYLGMLSNEFHSTTKSLSWMLLVPASLMFTTRQIQIDVKVDFI